MSAIQRFRDVLREYESTPESVGFEMRQQLASIIARGLRENGWTQADLARRMKVKPSQVSLLYHGDSNCTFDTAGRALFALGMRGKLTPVPSRTDRATVAADDAVSTILNQEQTNGEAIAAVQLSGEGTSHVYCGYRSTGPSVRGQSADDQSGMGGLDARDGQEGRTGRNDHLPYLPSRVRGDVGGGPIVYVYRSPAENGGSAHAKRRSSRRVREDWQDAGRHA